MGAGVEINYQALAGLGARITEAISPFSRQCGEVLSVAEAVRGRVPGLADAMLRFAGTWEHEMELLSQEVQLLGTALGTVAEYYAAQDEAIARGLRL